MAGVPASAGHIVCACASLKTSKILWGKIEGKRNRPYAAMLYSLFLHSLLSPPSIRITCAMCLCPQTKN